MVPRGLRVHPSPLRFPCSGQWTCARRTAGATRRGGSAAINRKRRKDLRGFFRTATLAQWVFRRAGPLQSGGHVTTLFALILINGHVVTPPFYSCLFCLFPPHSRPRHGSFVRSLTDLLRTPGRFRLRELREKIVHLVDFFEKSP